MENKVNLIPIQKEHKEIVMTMVKAFYQSSAVDHPVEEDILEDSFLAVAEESEKNIHGFLLEVEKEMVGYCYVTSLFSCEVGGLCIFLEEIYVLEGYQGRGFGKKVLEELIALYPKAKRFRLEVTPSNEGAKRLYERMGFEFLPYEQMVLEVKE